MLRLKNQVAIVTGASRGIGRAIAEAYAQEGAKVVINYNRYEKGALSLVEEIRAKGGAAIHIKADVSNAGDVKRLVQTAIDDFSRIDILVNNAGVLFTDTFQEVDEEVWDKTIDVNLKGAYLCSKEVAPVMLRQKRGRIINISSNSGLYHPSAMDNVEYVASKAGLNGLTKALAFKLGPFVTVNAICPGYIKTDMVANNNAQKEQRLLEETLLKRFGQPNDVAGAAVFLASSEADYITGELLIVAGGRGMH